MPLTPGHSVRSAPGRVRRMARGARPDRVGLLAALVIGLVGGPSLVGAPGGRPVITAPISETPFPLTAPTPITIQWTGPPGIRAHGVRHTGRTDGSRTRTGRHPTPMGPGDGERPRGPGRRGRIPPVLARVV
jgi:hypothetical protein